jgi:hypothetical protein
MTTKKKKLVSPHYFRQRANLCARAILLLKEARGLLVAGQCDLAAASVRRALKSTDGAHRHALGRMGRAK